MRLRDVNPEKTWNSVAVEAVEVDGGSVAQLVRRVPADADIMLHLPSA